jgi:O-antigen ligase/polysaccharide polymerase Wzy-like membrane protein
MRRGVLLTAAAVLLVGPTVLAFYSGGYFDGPRFAATITAWLLVLAVAVASPRPFPDSPAGRLALAGMALIAAWTGASISWAPLSEPATDSFVRLLLYLGALAAAAGAFRDRSALRAIEPVLALGVIVVIGYGLAGRLLPDLIQLDQSVRALGRLEQPITYWNAEGALAAIGLVLCARLSGTPTRPLAMRVLAAAGCAPLGLGIYLTYSRGAIAAALVGLVVLLATAPWWSQLRSAGIALGAALGAALAGGVFPTVASLEGTVSERQSDGVIVLVLLIAVMLAAGFAQLLASRAEGGTPVGEDRLGFASRLPAVAALCVALGLTVLVVAGLNEQGDAKELSKKTGVARLGSTDSRRYDYWRVGLDAFADHPLRGVGSGGFRVEWVRERPVKEAALEVHSLPLEMASELGLPGLLGLGMLVLGVGLAGRRSLQRHPELAPGACAALAVFGLHATIDWDWQLPAVTLPAIVMAGALIAASEWPSESPADSAA